MNLSALLLTPLASFHARTSLRPSEEVWKSYGKCSVLGPRLRLRRKFSSLPVKKALDAMTRKCKWIAPPGAIMSRIHAAMMYFHGINCILGGDSHSRWTDKEDADLHAAIRDAGLEGQPLVQKHVKIVTTFFHESPSGSSSHSEKGGAGVPCLPSFLFLCPSLRLFFSLSLYGCLGCSTPLQLTLHTLSLHLVMALLSLSLPFASVQLWRGR